MTISTQRITSLCVLCALVVKKNFAVNELNYKDLSLQ